MDGVTVVNTIQGICGYGNGTSVGFVFLAFFAVSLAILAIICFCIMIIEREPGAILPIIVCVGLTIGLGTAAIEQYHAKPIYGSQQVVLVDDDVSFNEFMDRYVIVAHEGELYTIYER